MNDAYRDNLETRVLLLAPTVKEEEEQTCAILARAGIACVGCADPVQVCEQLTAGAAAVLIAEEAVHGGDGCLAEWLGRQPPWSDMPVLILARTGADSAEVARALEEIGNVTVLERPARVATLVSAVRTALRARRRQYQLRDQLVQHERLSEQLRMSLQVGRAAAFTWDIPSNEIRRQQGIAPNFAATTDKPDTFEEIAAKVHPDDRDAFERRVRHAIERPGREYTNDYRLVGADGSVQWMSDTGHVEFSADEKPLRLVGLATEITNRKQAEEALRSANERFNLAVKCSHVVLWQQDLELRFTWLHNPAPGIDRSDATGKRDEDLLERAEDAAVIVALKREVIRSGVGMRREFSPHIQGVRHCFEVLMEPLRDAAGLITGITGAAIDITQLKRSEEARHEVERNYRALAVASSEIAYRMSADWSTMLPLDGRQLVASSDQPLADWAWLNQNVPRDEHLRVRLAIGEAIAGKTLFDLEHRVRRPDGSVGWTLSRAVPILDENGAVVAWFGAASDITSRKQAEEALTDRTQLLNGVLEGTTDVVFVKDLNGRCLVANTACAAVLGSTPDQVLGKTDEELYSPDIAAAIRQHDQAVIASGSPVQCEETFLVAGEPRVFLTQRSPLRGGGGCVVGVLGIGRDITDRKRTEAEREREQKTLATLVERCPFGIYIVDDEFRLTHMNAASENVAFGNVRPLIGRQFDEVLRIVWPEPVATDIINIFRHTLATGEPYSSKDFKNLRADTEQSESYEWQVHRITMSSGRPGVVCYYFDATELRQAETEVRDGEERMRLATEATGVGIWQWNVPTGEIHWDAQMFHIYGIALTPDRCVQYETWRGAVLPEDLPRQEELLQDTIRRHGRGSREFRIRRASDGACRVINSVETVRTSADGQVEWVLGTNLDITDQRGFETELRESEERLRMALTAAQAGAWTWEITTGVITWSPENYLLYGYDSTTRNPPAYADWEERLHPDDRGRANAAVADALAGRTPEYRHEFRVVHPVRGQRWLLGLGRVEFAPTGEPLRMVGINLDISSQKRAEDTMRRLAAELSDADRRKNVFLATLAHELRNPLAPVRNGLEVMKLSPNNGEAIEKVRAMMDRQLTQLVRLVDDLLDVSRITQGKVELRKERLDLRTVINAAIETIRPAIEQAGHELVVVVTDEPIFVHGDATRLAQVVSNLLHNSAKYTHRGGRILLTIGRKDGAAVVSVKDNGIGMPPAMIGRAFEMFAQLDRTLEKTTGGLGIGLSLAKALLEMHGGTIEAHSDGEGMGSEFVVRLPVLMDIVVRPDRPDVKASEVTLSALRRILVVDDNVDSAESLGQLLKILGNEVRTAHDGEAGVGVAAQFRPDLVLMDIGMPKLNGYEAARRIRQHPWGLDMVLVALTGWGQDDDRKKSAAAGFDHHLVKPVELQALMKLMSVPLVR